MTPGDRAAGWHPDETDAALLRYWDGSGWTPHTARAGAVRVALPGDVPVASAAPSRPEPALHRTIRLAEAVAEHTTIPTPPAARPVDDGRGTVRVAGPAGTITAAAALVIACAALAIALIG
ncbi:DUF2510 domain-containing protein [Agromyces sp. C10]|uniref:DUF2510 domain-containing protein n=1 Tax=Agromyces sp. C10 TaxID=2935077 RepID=UPI00200B3E54|nr:DUF2510 domain-containing protein [Agromyces sp. C10]MCK8609264.1 DUF2510 domain-containing protein [Agromyces sp. C10]